MGTDVVDPDLLVLKQIQSKWPSIAQDIALLTVPTSGSATYTGADIAAYYKLTDTQFTKLIELPQFRTLVEQEVAAAKELGPKAGVRLRAEALSLELQETLFSRAMAGDLDDKLSVQLLGMLMKSAGIDQPPEMVQAQTAHNTVNIAFNVPKLSNKKLAHIMNQPQTNVIEGESV